MEAINNFVLGVMQGGNNHHNQQQQQGASAPSPAGASPTFSGDGDPTSRPMDYSRVVSPDHRQWVDDNSKESCMLCDQIFTFTNRRHHCRNCFQLVCSACSGRTFMLGVQDSKSGRLARQRVCDECYAGLEITKEVQVGVGDQEKFNPATQAMVRIIVHEVRLQRQNGAGRPSRGLGIDGCGTPPAVGDVGFSLSEPSQPPQAPKLEPLTGGRRCSAAFCRIRVAKKQVGKTRSMDGVDPQWGEMFTFRVTLTCRSASYAVVDLFDRRSKMNSDEIIGRCRIPLHNIQCGAARDDWHRLFQVAGNGVAVGMLHVTVERLNGDPMKSAIPRLPFAELCVSVAPALEPPKLHELYPPGSFLHSHLFLRVGQGEDDFVPQNERILEAFDGARMHLVGRSNVNGATGDADGASSDVGKGSFILTTHRAIFITSDLSQQGRGEQRRARVGIMQLPIAMIRGTHVKRRWRDHLAAIELTCRDCRLYCFGFAPGSSLQEDIICMQAVQRVEEHIYWLKVEDEFAHRSRESPPAACEKSLSLQDPQQEVVGARCARLCGEYKRQGCLNAPGWRMSLANNQFELCRTYPQRLVVPSACSDRDIRRASQWRSRCRIPCLTWLNPITGAALVRSSQPMTGFMGGGCPEDETLLAEIRQTASSFATCPSSSVLARDLIAMRLDEGQQRDDCAAVVESWTFRDYSSAPLASTHLQRRLHIVDARPLLAAKGNTLLGKGHEILGRIGGESRATLEFLDIPNIHTVRESHVLFVRACCAEDDFQWFSALHDTSWLVHVRNLLRGAVNISQKLWDGDPVLVHCSDGWDRTSQLCSLAQLLLDPFYRTIQGLEALIEKDWCSFGHQFSSRTGWGAEPSDASPIFVQFLDAAWQLLQQFPTEFEFNENLLLLLAKHAYSRWFGDFLHDSENQRCSQSIQTVSVWSHVACEKPRFVNSLYQEAKASSQGMWLEPTCDLRSLRVWLRAYQSIGLRKALHHEAAHAQEKVCRVISRAFATPDTASSFSFVFNHDSSGHNHAAAQPGRISPMRREGVNEWLTAEERCCLKHLAPFEEGASPILQRLGEC